MKQLRYSVILSLTLLLTGCATIQSIISFGRTRYESPGGLSFVLPTGYEVAEDLWQSDSPIGLPHILLRSVDAKDDLGFPQAKMWVSLAPAPMAGGGGDVAAQITTLYPGFEDTLGYAPEHEVDALLFTFVGFGGPEDAAVQRLTAHGNPIRFYTATSVGNPNERQAVWMEGIGGQIIVVRGTITIADENAPHTPNTFTITPDAFADTVMAVGKSARLKTD